ncbi:hypothetical protein [Streptomyces sp. bgisy100]|uniref:hypothetical protein n=1 Tax=Streptomyces sp. bgisy100 TaxID=3413783 RepID=UPI003D7219D5
MSAGATHCTRTEYLALPVAAVLLVLALAAATLWERPAPYGDRLTLHPAAAAEPGPAPQPVLRMTERSVEARDPVSGARRWTYARSGRRPVTVGTVPGHSFTLWNDGMVTDTGPTAVRWHRSVPGATNPLTDRVVRRAGAVLRPLGPGWRLLAVLTPRRVTAYRSADGDLRWVLPARPGCSFAPRRTARRGAALLIAQPCTRPRGGADPPWTAELVAVDGTDTAPTLPGGPPRARGGLAP